MNPLESPDTLRAHLAEQPGVALYFSAPGCGVCSVLKPRLQALFAGRFPQLEWLEVDSAARPELAAQAQVFTIPTLVVYLDGREALRRARHFSPAEVEEALERPYGFLFDTP